MLITAPNIFSKDFTYSFFRCDRTGMSLLNQRPSQFEQFPVFRHKQQTHPKQKDFSELYNFVRNPKHLFTESSTAEAKTVLFVSFPNRNLDLDVSGVTRRDRKEERFALRKLRKDGNCGRKGNEFFPRCHNICFRTPIFHFEKLQETKWSAVEQRMGEKSFFG